MKRSIVVLTLVLVLGLASATVVTRTRSQAAPPALPTVTAVAVPPACSAGYVRLTFDDGPAPDTTARVLDALQASNATATFFVVGAKAERFPELVRRQQAEGHGVANHSWDHPRLTELTRDQVTSQLRRTSDAIQQVTGQRPTEFRPPYEDYDPTVRAIVQAEGMSMVLWDYGTDTKDWTGKSVAEIRDVVLDNARDGSIVLMHDSIQNTADAVPSILKGLMRKGLCTR